MRKILFSFFLCLPFAAAHASNSCQAFVQSAESKYGIPPGLLKAILTHESRCNPWAVNTTNSSRFFKSKADALTYIHKRRKQGCSNINIGCGQINLRSHGRNFKDVSNLLDPAVNVDYAARLLRKIYDKVRKRRHSNDNLMAWARAVWLYNSPTHGKRYQTKVFNLWKAHQKKEPKALLTEVSLKQKPARKIQVGLGKEKRTKKN